jgi:hypothetical protein
MSDALPKYPSDLPEYPNDLPHELHPHFPTFRDVVRDQMTTYIIEYISLWQSRAVEMSLWEKYRRSTPEKKAEMFWGWLSHHQPVPIASAPRVSEPMVAEFPPFPSSYQPPKPKKGKGGKGGKGGKDEKGGKDKKKSHGSAEQHQRCYAFMQRCVERLKQGNVADRKEVKDAFDIAAKQCPESSKKRDLVSAFKELML